MNRINRPLVKSQARQIIKSKAFYLFILLFIVSILTSGSVYFIDTNYNGGEIFEKNDNLSSFDSSSYSNPIEGFDGGESQNFSDFPVSPIVNTVFSFFLGFKTVASIIFAPLSVTLAGIFISLIRRNANSRFDLGKELTGLFKKTFNESYFKKLVLLILMFALTAALLLLFIVPGIIFIYSSYFSMQLMNDFPNLKPTEAIKLSRKIVRGNRSELFVYDLSFIPWALLFVVTFGIAGIYILPYKSTADALYYENFRLRALAIGRITPDDFLSEKEKFAKMAAGYNNFTGSESGENYAGGNSQNDRIIFSNGTYFTPDFSPINPFYNNGDFSNGKSDSGYYYAPPTQDESKYYYNSSQYASHGSERDNASNNGDEKQNTPKDSADENDSKTE